MTLSVSDFPHIKWSLLTFLLVLGMGSTIILACEGFVAQAQHDQRNAQHQLNEARSRLAAAREDHENMRAYALEYNALLQRNVLGNDQRLDWVEGLEKIHHRAPGFTGFKYAIAPQSPYLPDPPLDSGNFDLNLSGMTLQFDLLHEEQLAAFFDALRTDIKGWFILDHCSLERAAAPGEGDKGLPPSRATPRLKAECGGGWLTLNSKGAK